MCVKNCAIYKQNLHYQQPFRLKGLDKSNLQIEVHFLTLVQILA
jgi:hypothetical protein